MTTEQEKLYKQYMNNISHWKRHFEYLQESDLKTLLYRAAEAEVNPIKYWNEMKNSPEATIKLNEAVADSFLMFNTDTESGIKTSGVQTHYIVVIFNYLKTLTYFQTIDEIHAGIVKGYEKLAKKYEKSGNIEMAQQARQRIPEEGTISGRVLELETAGIANKVKVIRETIKNGKKTIKNKSGFMLPLDLKDEKWGIILNNRWKAAAKELNNKGSFEKQTAKILIDLRNNIYLTKEEKCMYADSLFKLFKVDFYDPNEANFDDLKRIDKEINMKAEEEREFKRNERLEKEAQFKKSKALSDAMRKEMNLSSIDFKDDTSDTWRETSEEKNWSEIIEKSNQESELLINKAREDADRIAQKYGLGKYKK